MPCCRHQGTQSVRPALPCLITQSVHTENSHQIWIKLKCAHVVSLKMNITSCRKRAKWAEKKAKKKMIKTCVVCIDDYVRLNSTQLSASIVFFNVQMPHQVKRPTKKLITVECVYDVITANYIVLKSVCRLWWFEKWMLSSIVLMMFDWFPSFKNSTPQKFGVREWKGSNEWNDELFQSRVPTSTFTSVFYGEQN